MSRNFYEIRDAVHVFIKFNNDEKKVIDSAPFQRLHFIHQLAMSFLVYPGATHKRFEHSLGVMELAGKVFDIIINPDNVHPIVRTQIPEITQTDKFAYWKKIVRIAALCHDLGHLPFSHAAEKELLPEGWDHERLTREIIFGNEMQVIWESSIPPVKPGHIVKIALGPRNAKDMNFSLWETILSEIITSAFFGVDRIDYLLRDSLHTGVAYGRFDYHRLIDTLRILPSPQLDENNQDLNKSEPALGIESGGLHSAEALMLARYFMFKQVYMHRVRRIYDIHLMDFLKQWLHGGKFSISIQKHSALTDCEILAEIRKRSKKKGLPGYKEACIITQRKHFKLFYERDSADIKKNKNASEIICKNLISKFGEEKVRYDKVEPKEGGIFSFPVLTHKGEIRNSLQLSETLQKLPEIAVNSIYIDRDIEKEADEWLQKEKNSILQCTGGTK